MDISGRQKKIDALQKRINDVKDRVFADFSKKVGAAGPVVLEQGASVVPIRDRQSGSKTSLPAGVLLLPPTSGTGVLPMHVGIGSHLR